MKWICFQQAVPCDNVLIIVCSKNRVDLPYSIGNMFTEKGQRYFGTINGHYSQTDYVDWFWTLLEGP